MNKMARPVTRSPAQAPEQASRPARPGAVGVLVATPGLAREVMHMQSLTADVDPADLEALIDEAVDWARRH